MPSNAGKQRAPRHRTLVLPSPRSHFHEQPYDTHAIPLWQSGAIFTKGTVGTREINHEIHFHWSL